MVLWNTRYLDAALAQVRTSRATVKPEDVERLSPLLLDHINVLGRYEFNLKKSIRQGKLRPTPRPRRAGRSGRVAVAIPVFCSIATHGPR